VQQNPELDAISKPMQKLQRELFTLKSKSNKLCLTVTVQNSLFP
jgi:hypothetical protein